jgi:hypothetical protein
MPFGEDVDVILKRFNLGWRLDCSNHFFKYGRRYEYKSNLTDYKGFW